jgi:hypothetical protein
MVEVWMAFTQPGTQSLAVMWTGLGISPAMIGPGTWSSGAQLHGRKQILPLESRGAGYARVTTPLRHYMNLR